MQLTEDQANDLLSRTAIAAIYYDPDEAVLVPSYSIHADLDFVLEALDGVTLTDDERDQLRVMCGRVITDPTQHRRDLLNLVLSATAQDPAASE